MTRPRCQQERNNDVVPQDADELLPVLEGGLRDLRERLVRGSQDRDLLGRERGGEPGLLDCLEEPAERPCGPQRLDDVLRGRLRACRARRREAHGRHGQGQDECAERAGHLHGVITLSRYWC